ncbi:MAG: hypothetical protein ACREBG_06105 [Pyrinomonadaceae bacterium]
MLVRQFGRILVSTVLLLLVVALTTTAFGQGRGRGGGRGSGGGGGVGHGGGPPAGVGVDRGLGNASERSDGRSDHGLARASENSKGRSDRGLERARMASNNLRHADEDLRNHPGIARTLHTNANDLRAGYQAALATNPDLKFGHYVAATRLAQNLGSRHPAITRSAILAGLASRRSLGQTLQDLGLSEHAANEARKQADREIKRGRR